MRYLSRPEGGEVLRAGVVWKGFLEVELSQILKAMKKGKQEEESWRGGTKMYDPGVGVINIGQKLIVIERR